MFRFVGSLLGHAKLLTVAGVTASTVAIAPVAAHTFQSNRSHTPDRADRRGEQVDFRGTAHEGETRAWTGHDRFNNGRLDHDHFDRRSNAPCDTHFHPLEGGHRGFSR